MQKRAWYGVMKFPLDGRSPKPRASGLTMIIDKGLGLKATEDLLHLAADCIDFVKLSFGTSAFYQRELLQRKNALIRSHGVDVYPGGTFFEIAVLQNCFREFLAEAKELGFTALEVSDGTITLDPDQRWEAVATGLAAGFKVVTEVGKKHPADQISQSDITRLIAGDLAAGAFKVIVEGRESGLGVVIYDERGDILTSDLENLIEAVGDPGRLIWEAPLKKQQQDLIMRFGPNVNLGNVQPEDILALEALRVGLRGDTLRATLAGGLNGSPWLNGDEGQHACAH